MLRTRGGPHQKQPETAFDKRKKPPLSPLPAFMPLSLVSSLPSLRVPLTRHPPPLYSLSALHFLLVSFLPLPPSPPLAWPPAAAPGCPSRQCSSPLFCCFDHLKNLRASKCPTESHPLHASSPARIPNARESKNPGHAAGRRRHLHLIPTPPLVLLKCPSSSLLPFRSQQEQTGVTTGQSVEAAMKSPPIMDPEALPPPPGTPPDDEVRWVGGGRSCLVFQRSNLVGRGSCSRRRRGS